MRCTLHCTQTGTGCENNDVHLLCAWTNALMEQMNENNAVDLDEAVRHCSQVHYDALGMDEVLRPFIGKPDAFYRFLQDEWHWIVTVEEDGKRILADENKAECVCPLVRAGAVHTPNLCHCSEGFAEMMFSKVLGQKVSAQVQKSVLRGDGHCVYEINLN